VGGQDNGHRWAKPSISHLQNLMRHVVNNPDEVPCALCAELYPCSLLSCIPLCDRHICHDPRLDPRVARLVRIWSVATAPSVWGP